MNLHQLYLKERESWEKDPNFVKGYNGKAVPREKAVEINGKYYEKEVSALLIRGIWYEKRDTHIRKDAYTGKMDHVTFMKKVIINKNKDIDYVSKDCPIVLCRGTDTDVMYEAISPEVASELGFEECFNSGNFFPKGQRSPYYDHKLGPQMFNHVKKLKKKEGIVEQNIPHNTKYGLASHTFIKSEGKQYTFGVEMETSTGVLPKHSYVDKFNLSCVRDGSVTGGEYVTGILKGDQGLLHLRKICKELYKRCDVDERTGVHIHVGNFIPNKEFTIYSFILGHLIQDELFAMLPSSRRSGEYSQPLDPSSSVYRKVLSLISKAESEPKIGYQSIINEAYEEVFKWLSRGVEPGDGCNKYGPHPQGRYCGGHSSPRYKWLNLVATNFSRARQDDQTSESSPSWTIEFRSHSGTLSYKKIEAWVLICFAFVWFVEHRQKTILEVVTGKRTLQLRDVLTESYPKSYPTLLKYVVDRTHLFSSSGLVKESKDIQVEDGSTIDFLKENFKQSPINEEKPKRKIYSSIGYDYPF